MFWIDFLKLRRNVNRRRKRGWDSVEEFIESVCGVDGDVWLNLSKNVLFLFNDVLVVGTDEDKFGNAILGKVIGFDFIRFEIIWNGWVVVGVDVNEEIDVGDKAK